MLRVWLRFLVLWLDWLDFGYVVLIVGIDCCGLACDLFWVRLGVVSVGIVCSFMLRLVFGYRFLIVLVCCHYAFIAC